MMREAERFEADFPTLLSTASRAAIRVVRDPTASQDIAAETMRRLFERWSTIDADRAPAWTARVARNLAIDHLRRRRPTMAAPAPTDPADGVVSRLDLVNALSALPARQREAVGFKYLADLSDAEVATALGVSVATARTHIRRALDALRAQFDTDPEAVLTTARRSAMPSITPVAWQIDPAAHPLGELVDRRTIRFVRRYPVHCDILWDAIVGQLAPGAAPPWADGGDDRRAALGAWFIPIPTHLEARLGGRFWFGDPDDEVMSGTVVGFDPGRQVLLSNRNGSGQQFQVASSGDESTLVFTHWLPPGFALPQDRPDDGVDLHRTDNYAWNHQPGGPGSYQPALAACWHGSLYNLGAYLGGTTSDTRAAESDLDDADLYTRYCSSFTETMPEW